MEALHGSVHDILCQRPFESSLHCEASNEQVERQGTPADVSSLSVRKQKRCGDQFIPVSWRTAIYFALMEHDDL